MTFLRSAGERDDLTLVSYLSCTKQDVKLWLPEHQKTLEVVGLSMDITG